MISKGVKSIFPIKHQDIWDRVNDPNYDDGMREPEEVYNEDRNL